MLSTPKISEQIKEIKEFDNNWPPQGLKKNLVVPKTWKKWKIEEFEENSIRVTTEWESMDGY